MDKQARDPGEAWEAIISECVAELRKADADTLERLAVRMEFLGQPAAAKLARDIAEEKARH